MEPSPDPWRPHQDDSWIEDDWEAVETAFNDVVTLPTNERVAAIDALPDPVRRGVRVLLDSAPALDARLAPSPRSVTELGLPPGTVLGRFVVRRRVGSGGMGAVYLADDPDTREQAAVKVLTSSAPSAATRFAAEQHLFRFFDHPSIPGLLGVGTTPGGRPYFAMDFVDGRSITEIVRSRSLGTLTRLELFAGVCDAVRHIHRRGVVHRDIKPSNVLVSEHPDGRLKVHLLDFGIAKLLADVGHSSEWKGPGLTEGAASPMTPAYAAPEQLGTGAVTTGTDVYALGNLLYELMTGCRPMDGGVPPSRLVDLRVPKTTSWAIDSLVARAIDPDPLQRYASAEDLLSDVNRVLDGLPPLDARIGYAMSALWFLSRRRTGLVMATVCVASVIAAFAAADHRWRSAAEASAAAEARVAAVFSEVLRTETAHAGESFGEDRQFLVSAGRSIHDGLQGIPEMEADLSLAVADRLAAQGVCDEAAPLYGRAALLRTVTASNHPVVIASLRGQARCVAGPVGVGSAVQARRAAEYAEQSLVLAVSRYGTRSSVAAAIGTDLALYHALGGDPAAAWDRLAMAQAVLGDTRQASAAPRRPPSGDRGASASSGAFSHTGSREWQTVASARAEVVAAVVHVAQGAYGPAAVRARQAVATLLNEPPALAADHSERAEVAAFGLSVETDALVKLGRLAPARVAADQAVTILTGQFGSADPRTVRARAASAAVAARGGASQVIPTVLAALLRDAEATGDDGLLSTVLQTEGLALLLTGQRAEARAALTRAVDFGRHGESRSLALAHASLADLDREAGRLDAALDHSDRAVRLARDLPPADGLSLDILLGATTARAAALAQAGRGGEAVAVLGPVVDAARSAPTGTISPEAMSRATSVLGRLAKGD